LSNGEFVKGLGCSFSETIPGAHRDLSEGLDTEDFLPRRVGGYIYYRYIYISIDMWPRRPIFATQNLLEKKGTFRSFCCFSVTNTFFLIDFFANLNRPWQPKNQA
jgi:hypothetical protein